MRKSNLIGLSTFYSSKTYTIIHLGQDFYEEIIEFPSYVEASATV